MRVPSAATFKPAVCNGKKELIRVRSVRACLLW